MIRQAKTAIARIKLAPIQRSALGEKERDMQELKIFESAEFGAVRALEIDGAP